MKAKNIIAYILIIVAIVFTLIFIGQLQSFFTAILSINRIFSTETDSYNKGKIIGSFIYWVFHLFIIIFLFFKGIKMLKNKRLQQDI